MTPSVSVVLRCRDEARHLRTLLADLRAQHTEAPVEIVAVDSGSSDDSVAILERHDVRVHHLDRHRFSYGRSLNTGVQAARGAVVVLISAHCRPCSPDWLARLTEPLASADIVGTFGRQVPEPGMNPIEAVTLARLFPERGPSPVRFSNANAALHRAAVLARPFDEDAPTAEDHLWALGLGPGERLVYTPTAAVTHTHPMSFRHWWQRFYLDGLAASYARHRYRSTMPWEETPATSRGRTGMRVLREILATRRLTALAHLPTYLAARHLAYARGTRDGEQRWGDRS
jgi:glycosyltransferase involved in cell wall biosynthesis